MTVALNTANSRSVTGTARARAAGATIVEEPSLHDYGEAYWADRAYGATDPEGHLWWFVQRLRDPPQ